MKSNTKSVKVNAYFCMRCGNYLDDNYCSTCIDDKIGDNKHLEKSHSAVKDILKTRCDQIANTLESTDLRKVQRDTLGLIYKIIEVM